MSEEAELAEPIVDRDDDDTFCHQVAWIVAITLADNESSAVDPEHHGKEVRTPLVGLSGSEHVQEQAILARTRSSVWRGDLRAVRAESRRVAHAVPALVILRRAPPKVSDGRRGVGDSAELLHCARCDTSHRAQVRGHDRRCGRGQQGTRTSSEDRQCYSCGDTVLDPARPYIVLPPEICEGVYDDLYPRANRQSRASAPRLSGTTGSARLPRAKNGAEQAGRPDRAVHKLTAEVQNLLKPRSVYQDPTLVQRVMAIMTE